MPEPSELGAVAFGPGAGALRSGALTLRPGAEASGSGAAALTSGAAALVSALAGAALGSLAGLASGACVDVFLPAGWVVAFFEGELAVALIAGALACEGAGAVPAGRVALAPDPPHAATSSVRPTPAAGSTSCRRLVWRSSRVKCISLTRSRRRRSDRRRLVHVSCLLTSPSLL